MTNKTSISRKTFLQEGYFRIPLSHIIKDLFSENKELKFLSNQINLKSFLFKKSEASNLPPNYSITADSNLQVKIKTKMTTENRIEANLTSAGLFQ